MPAMECPGVRLILQEGDVLSVDFDSGEVRNARSGESCRARVLPPMLRDILKAGGILQILAKDGFIDPV